MLLGDWKEANVRTVATSYSQFAAIEPPPGLEAILAWDGVIEPLKDCRDLGFILEDLRRDRTVVVQGGTVLHDPDCTSVHHPISFLDKLNPRDVRIRLLVLAHLPKRHPRAFAKTPEISKRTFPLHPHLNSDGSICAHSASDSMLPWHGQTVRTFLDYVAIWAVKHHVWQMTGANEQATWLGSALSHNPSDLLRQVGRNDPCPCGSGKKFKRCHFPICEQQRAAIPVKFMR